MEENINIENLSDYIVLKRLENNENIEINLLIFTSFICYLILPIAFKYNDFSSNGKVITSKIIRSRYPLGEYVFGIPREKWYLEKDSAKPLYEAEDYNQYKVFDSVINQILLFSKTDNYIRMRDSIINEFKEFLINKDLKELDTENAILFTREENTNHFLINFLY